MNKNYVNVCNQLLEKSFALTEIVNLLTEKNNKAFVQFEKWLQDTEEVMKKNKISNVLEISSLRAKVVALKFDTSMTRKEKFVQLSDILYELKSIFMPVLKPLEDKIEESKVIIRQCLQYLEHTDKMPKKTKKIDFTSYIHSVWSEIQAQPELKNAYVNLISKVSINDVLLIIADEINI